MLSLLRSMENSSSQELLVRLSRMVENDRRIELVSVTTCKQPRPAGEGVSTTQGWGGRQMSNYQFTHYYRHTSLWDGEIRGGGAASLSTAPPDSLCTNRGWEESGV